MTTLNALGQTLPDSGFTNKHEAKNLYKDSLKEGKWIEYTGFIGTSATVGRHSFNDLVVFPNDTDTNHATLYKLIVYKKGKPIGIIKTFYKKSNKLESVDSCKDGEINGMSIGYYESGKINWTQHSSFGKIDGIVYLYDEDGQLASTTPYLNGKTEGVVKQYLPIGKLRYESSFSNGIRNGYAKQYYYPSGKLWIDHNFTNGQLDGVEKVYAEDGKLKEETTYANGSIIATKYYDENGNEIKQ